jgi:hypothetical protein
MNMPMLLPLFFFVYSMDVNLACISFMTIAFSPSQRSTLKYYDVELCLSLQIYQFYINSPAVKKYTIPLLGAKWWFTPHK